MTKRKKQIIIWSSLVGLIVLGSITYVWKYHSECHRHHHSQKLTWLRHELKDELDLNKRQVQFLHETKRELLAHKKKFQSKKSLIFTKLSDEVRKNSMDKNVLRQLAKRVKKSHMISQEDLIINKLVTFHAMLSAEQKEKLAEKLQKFADKHRKNSSCCSNKDGNDHH